MDKSYSFNEERGGKKTEGRILEVKEKEAWREIKEEQDMNS